MSSNSDAILMSSTTTSSSTAAATAAVAAATVAALALDLNIPPPTSSIPPPPPPSDSSSSSNSPTRSEISSVPATNAAPPPPPPPLPPSPLPSVAASEAEAIKQQLAATTFIQADVMNFREVVQKHTGAAEDAQDKMPVTLPARQSGGSKAAAAAAAAAAAGGDAAAPPADKKDGPPPVAAPPYRRHMLHSKLHERKQNNLRNLDIAKGGSPLFKRPGCSPRGAADISPKLGDATSAQAAFLGSPVTPLSKEPFETSNPPLTPTEQLRHSFASALNNCFDDNHPSSSTNSASNSPNLLDRFPFHHQHHVAHNGGMILQAHQQNSNLNHSNYSNLNFQQQQQQQLRMQQQQQNHSPLHSPVAMAHHHHHHLMIHHQQQIAYEQQIQQVHQQQQIQIQMHHNQMQMHHNQHLHSREPELLDLFPMHSSR